MKKFFWAVVLVAIVPLFVRAESVTIEATADAALSQRDVRQNFGTGLLFTQGPMSADFSLIKFDLSRVPSGSVVNRATVLLNLVNASCGQMKLWLYRVTSPWSENSVTYATKPSITYQNASSILMLGSGEVPVGYHDWSVTSIVRTWIAQRSSNHGLQLSYDVMDDCLAQFSSREGDKKPTLIVEYTPPADRTKPVPTNIWAQVERNYVWIRWKTTNDVSNSRVNFKRSSDRSWGSASADEMETNHAVYLSALSSNTTYQYKVQSTDRAGNIGESAIYEFTTASVSGSGSTPAPSTSTPNANPPANNQTTLNVFNVIDDVLGPTSARVKWWSNLPGTSVLFVSKNANDSTPISAYDPPYGQNDEEETHEVIAQGLTPSTTYSYRVMTHSVDNQVDVSDRYTFATLAAGAPTQSTPPRANEENYGERADGSADPALSEAQKQAAIALGEDPQALISEVNGNGEGTEKNNNDKVKDDMQLAVSALKNEKASLWEKILFVGSRLLIQLLMLLAAIIVFIVWLIGRKKKNENTDVPGNISEKRKKIIWVVVIVFALLLLIASGFLLPALILLILLMPAVWLLRRTKNKKQEQVVPLVEKPVQKEMKEQK